MKQKICKVLFVIGLVLILLFASLNKVKSDEITDVDKKEQVENHVNEKDKEELESKEIALIVSDIDEYNITYKDSKEKIEELKSKISEVLSTSSIVRTVIVPFFHSYIY